MAGYPYNYGYTMQKITEKAVARNIEPSKYLEYLQAKRKNRSARGKKSS